LFYFSFQEVLLHFPKHIKMRAKITQKLCYLILFFSCFYATAQLNRSWHDHYEVPLKSSLSGSTLVFSTNNFTPGLFDSCYISGIRKNGVSVFKKKILKHEYTTVSAMRVLSDHSILVLGYARGCDYIDSSGLNFILKLDTLGNILTDVEFKNLNGTSYNPDNLVDISEYQDSTLFAVSDSFLFRFSSGAAILQKTKLPFSGVKGFQLTNSGNLLFSTFSGVAKLVVTDTALNVLAQDTLPDFYTKLIETTTGNWYGLNSQKKIDRIDTNLDLIASTSSIQNTKKVTDFLLSNDTLILSVSTTLGDSSFVLLCDTALNLLQSSPIAITPLKSTSIQHSGASLFIFGEETTDATSNHNIFTSLLEVDKFTGNGNFISDARVSLVTIDTAYTVAYYIPGPNHWLVTYFYSMEVTVQNNGTDTLHTVTINHNPYNYPYCGFDFYSEKFSGLSLAPGQTVILQTPIIAKGAAMPLSQPPTNTITISACFWTSAPNQRSDIDHSNDEICGTYTYITTGLADQHFVDDLSVFPNPFRETITISDENSSICAIELYSADGKLIQKKGEGDSKIKHVSAEGIAPGFYVLKLYHKDGNTQLIKLIKEF
jgi:hypothetical protein